MKLDTNGNLALVVAIVSTPLNRPSFNAASVLISTSILGLEIAVVSAVILPQMVVW